MLKHALLTIAAFSVTLSTAFAVGVVATPAHADDLVWCDIVVYHSTPVAGADKKLRDSPDPVTGKKPCYGTGTQCKDTIITLPTGGQGVQCDVYLSS